MKKWWTSIDIAQKIAILFIWGMFIYALTQTERLMENPIVSVCFLTGTFIIGIIFLFKKF